MPTYMHRIVHCTQYTLYTVHGTGYIVHCTVYSVQCTLYSVYCILRRTVYAVHLQIYENNPGKHAHKWWTIVNVFAISYIYVAHKVSIRHTLRSRSHTNRRYSTYTPRRLGIVWAWNSCGSLSINSVF